MNPFKTKSRVIALVISFIFLCLAAGSAGAAQDEVWPVKTQLKAKDWIVDTPDAWVTVGDVEFVNGHHVNGDLQITINSVEPYKIGEANIHIVQDTDDFASVLDKKTGNPKASKFDYKTDYLKDEGILADNHVETIPLSNFEICWGPNLTTCPPLYTIVSVILYEEQLIDGITTWVKVPENAYAENDGVFERYDKDDGRIWGMYVTYPPAKVEPGHFVDAIVNGLRYVTITQTNFGTTGEGGQFWYLPGEHIAFYVGSLSLGYALGDHQISPPDLFGGADMDDDRVLNVARLLQSLDADGNAAQGAINITEEVVACLESALSGFLEIPEPDIFFADDDAVGALIDATIAVCNGKVSLAAVTKAEALDNLNNGMQAGNLMKRNISKSPEMKSAKAKIEIMPVYVTAQQSDGTLTSVDYFNTDGEVIETRDVAKPIVVSYLDEAKGTSSLDVFVAISRDDGDTWKRRNVSKTADKSSLMGYPGESWKPMLKVKDNKIFIAWTDKYCRGGRPGYAITVCPPEDPGCEICRETDEGTKCFTDYPGDDAYWQDDIFGVGGPQRSVIYDDYPEMGEVPYSCVWTARGVVETNGEIQWFKPEKLTSGRRDAFQIFAGAGTGVAFAIVWQEDPKGLMPGDGAGPGDGWSGANTNNKADIWYSYITLSDFARVDSDYPMGEFGENNHDIGDTDTELAGRLKALVPMSLPVRISDNEVCSAENMNPTGGHGDHDFDGEGEGTHRYCGDLAGIGTAASPGTNPLCAYTVEKANPKGEIHNVCVTADGRLLDGNTGSSRPNIFLQPYKPASGPKSAWVIIGYEESKGVGSPPEGEHDDDGCGGGDDYIPVWPVVASDEPDEDRYKPDMGKNVIFHSFDLTQPVTVASGGIINLPETDEHGNLVYLLDEFGEELLDWEGEPQLAYENARRVRFVTQPKSKAGDSKTVLVALYREGEEGRGKPADVFMRRMVAPEKGNPFAFKNFLSGAKNLSSVEPTDWFKDPFDDEKPIKMLRWAWSVDNLEDSSAKNPFSDARAHRGALNGDDLIIGYTWTPNWGRKANDKYDFYVRRSFNGGKAWTTDPMDTPIEHNVVFRVPVIDEVTQTVTWEDEVVSTEYAPGAAEPPRNVSNLRNNRVTVAEPRLVKTPGTIKNPDGSKTDYPEDIWDSSVYQLAYGLDFNQNTLPDGVEYPKMPLDIYYSRTLDKGQRYQSVIITPQGGNGKPEEGWNPLAKDKPQQGAAQLRQTPDGSRLYGIWLEEGDNGSDIMFRRVDYRD